MPPLRYTVGAVTWGAQTEQSPPVSGVATLDRLVADGKVSPDLYDEVLIHAQRTQSTVEEIVLQLGLMSETELLTYVAGLYRTRFVSSEKLAKAGIDPWLLAKVPKKLAKRLNAFPILYDQRTRTLSVVAADVRDDDVRQQMQFTTGARDVKVYVGREAAIRALVAKHYDDDGRPFEMLLSGASSRAVGASGASDPAPGDWGQVFEEGDGRLVRRRRAISLELEEAANDQLCESEEPPEQTHARATASQGHTLSEQHSAAPQPDLALDPEVYLGTLSVLVTLIEQLNHDRGGHSMRVAKVCEQLGERIRLTPQQARGLPIAAYLHDVGVSASAHVTQLDVAHDSSKRDLAERNLTVPIRLLESVALPETAVAALRHRFERFDGRGFPDRLAGDSIPLGARVLAVAESYVDLTQNKGNILGRRLASEDACDALARYQGSVFDPEVVDWLRHLVVGDEMEIIAKAARVVGDSTRRRNGGRGVSGSLQEMALPDVIQILANGRKSGRLRVSSGTLRGEMTFQDGSIHGATFGDLEGAEAVYGILRLTDGDFFLEPVDGPVEDAIGIPTHHLLLEAMRRLDEEQR